jgi:hypothetical protein
VLAGSFSKIGATDKHNFHHDSAELTLILTFSLREKELPFPSGEGRVRGVGDALITVAR